MEIYEKNCPDAYNPEQTDADKDNAGDMCDFELAVINSSWLWITPESLNVNPGVLTVHTAFPYPYAGNYAITDAKADGVAYNEIAGENIKFRRQDFNPERLDTHFDIEGRFTYNNKDYVFTGSGNISKIEPDAGKGKK